MKHLNWEATNVAILDDLIPEAQERIASTIVNNFRDWRNQRRGYEEVWRAIDRQLNQYDPIHTPLQKTEYNTTLDGPTIMGSKLKMGNVYAHREGIVAAIMKFLMANDYDFFDVVSLDPTDDAAMSAVKEYLMWLYGTMDFENEFLPFVRGWATYGTGIASYEWIEETATRWRTERIQNPETGEETTIRYKATDTIYNAPRFTPVNLYRSVLDPGATDIKTATLIFQKMITPFDILANPAYGNMDEDWLFGLPDAGADEDSVMDTLREQTLGNVTQEPTGTYKGKKKVYEAWGDFTDGHTLYQNYVAEVAGGKLIRFEPNPYDMPHKPFIVARFSIEPNSVYGRSPLAAIAGIQAGYDTIINQVIDSNAMHIERPILVGVNNLVQDKNDKKAIPPMGKNVVWRVRDIATAASRMRDPDYAGIQGSTQILGVLGEAMKMLTGDNELMSGGSIQDQYATTGHVVTVAEAGNARFNMYAKTLEREAIVPMLEMTLDLLRQRSLEPLTIKTKDSSLGTNIQFHPEMLLGNIAFSMRGASYNATKQLQINAMQNFYQMALASPVTQQIFNWVRVATDMGDALGIRGIRNQLVPQAMMMEQQAPKQPGIWQQMAGLFNKQVGSQLPGPDVANLPQAPVNGGPQIGQQLGNSIAPSVGGTDPANSAQSPFNVAPQNLAQRAFGFFSGRSGAGS